MTRRLLLHPDEPLLLVQSEYNDGIRLTIKSFRGARWDGQRRVWQLPLEHRDRVIELLAPFDFAIDDEVLAIEGEPAAPPIDPADETLSVQQVNLLIGGALMQRFPAPVWVRGEVTGFDKGARRKHWYFELVEKAARADEVAARLPIVVFQSRRERIERRLANAAEPLALRDGLEVRVRGRVEYYSAGGRLQLIVDDIDPDFAFGQLARRRREIVAQIQATGLAGLNAARPWPALPLCIGLITSADSDALHDVVTTFSGSPFGFRLLHVPAAVQGSQLEPEVLAALDFMEEHAQEVDLVLLVRGGGARSDLAWFDNLAIAQRIARHPCKVVLGIGHERDRSVLAEVAHAEKTPTAAAELVVGMVSFAEDQLERMARQLADRTRRRLANEQQRTQRQRARLTSQGRSALRRAAQRVERELAPRVGRAARSRLSVERTRLSGLSSRLSPERVGRPLAAEASARSARARRLERASRARLAALTQHLDLATARLSAVDPRQALARGFAILHNEEGRVVREPADAPMGTVIRATLHRGRLAARVTEHEPDDEES